MTSRRKPEQDSLQDAADREPPTWADIEAALGNAAPEALEKLCGEWEGRKLTVPMKAKSSKLANVIGDAGAEIVVKLAPGLRITVPTNRARKAPERRARIIELRAAGYTQQEIALKVGCTERTVFNTLRA